MTMTSSKLTTEFAAIVPEAAELQAAQNFADAYANYAADAQALSKILPAGVALGKAAMLSALAGVSTPGAAAAGLKAAVQAFWAAVAGGLTTSFAGATAITPPPLSGLDLQPVFDDATNTPFTQAQAAAALAVEFHANVAGGTVTTPPSVVTPIT